MCITGRKLKWYITPCLDVLTETCLPLTKLGKTDKIIAGGEWKKMKMNPDCWWFMVIMVTLYPLLLWLLVISLLSAYCIFFISKFVKIFWPSISLLKMITSKKSLLLMFIYWTPYFRDTFSGSLKLHTHSFFVPPPTVLYCSVFHVHSMKKYLHDVYQYLLATTFSRPTSCIFP